MNFVIENRTSDFEEDVVDSAERGESSYEVVVGMDRNGFEDVLDEFGR